MNKVETEQLIRHLVNERLQNCTATNSVREVFLVDYTRNTSAAADGKPQHAMRAVHYTTLGRAYIIFGSPEQAAIAHETLGQALTLDLGEILGVNTGRLQMSFSIVANCSYQDRENKRSAEVGRAIARAKAEMIAGNGDLYGVEVQLQVKFKSGYFQELRFKSDPAAAESQLMEALDGDAVGILSAAFSVRQDSYLVNWDGPATIFVQNEHRAQSLVRTLKASVNHPRSKLTNISLKSEAKVSLIRTTQAQPSASAEMKLATPDQVRRVLLENLFNDDECAPATLPARTKEGNDIIWKTVPASQGRAETLQTSLDQLPEVVDVEGNSRDVRLILQEAPDTRNRKITSELLFDTMMNLVGDKLLEIEVSDDGDYYKLFLAVKYQLPSDGMEMDEGAAAKSS
jgi:hypothetical protein